MENNRSSILQGSSYMQCKTALEEFNTAQSTSFGSKEEETLSGFGLEILESVQFHACFHFYRVKRPVSGTLIIHHLS